MRMRIIFIVLFFASPCFARADFIVPTSVTPTFENQQHLVLTAQIQSPSTPLLDQSVLTLPINMPISISYSVARAPNWPFTNSSDAIKDSLFSDMIEQQSQYLELWEGIPYTSSAHLVQSWNVSATSSGQVSATIPEEGNYFLIDYFPDGYYIDPQSVCSNDSNWQTDCEPQYTLDQVREYFTTPFGSPTDPPSIPDAFGGIQFSVKALETSLKTSNVLFLPGIEGSRLYMRNAFGLEQTVWEPSIFSSISSLALNSDGTSENEIYTRDLVDYVYGIKALGDVYGPFEDYMNGLVENGIISKWQAYPYDWRYDVRDIVANGTLVATSSGEMHRVYVQDVVESLASSSPTGKVTIIAHSNGGLLAKALAIELAKENKLDLVDRIIFIGSPQYGTPLTIGSLLNGDGQTDPTGGLIMYGGTVRAAASTLPGMYGLLPSSAYFKHVADAPVLFVTNALNDVYEKNFGSEINSADELLKFLTDVPALHTLFPANDLRTPLVLSSEIIQKETDMHDELDSWIPPASLKVITISGWGNLTPYQYTYGSSPKKYLSCFRTDVLTASCAYSYRVTHSLKDTESGDNTVVSESALADDADTFYFNAKDFKKAKLGTIGHGNLTSAPPIQSLVQKIITQDDTQNSTQSEVAPIPYISTSSPESDLAPLTVVSVHSPLNIVATDASGNQTGIFEAPDHAGIYYKKEDIDGSSLQLLDDEKYLYLPQDQTYNISLQGYDYGESEIDIGTMDANGNVSTTESFENIPTTASTTILFSLVTSSSDATSTLPTEISVDTFGNGLSTPVLGTFSQPNENTNSSEADISATTSDASATTTDASSTEAILKKSFQALQVRRGVKNRFLSELGKIQSFGPVSEAQDEITYLEKLITAQVQINLTDNEATFFLNLLDSIRGNLDGFFN